jgi:hypothetical protein
VGAVSLNDEDAVWLNSGDCLLINNNDATRREMVSQSYTTKINEF